MSKKVTIVENEGVTEAVVSDATIGDIVTTIISTDSAVTGVYGIAQRAALVLAGMSAQEFRRSGSINPF